MKKIIIIISLVIVLSLIMGVSFFLIFNKKIKQTLAISEKQASQIEAMIKQRRQEKENLEQGDAADLFAKNGIIKILFIGLDNRIGQTSGHCDAIQLIEINKTKHTITITAVPRGTYSPLPVPGNGTGYQPTDYYIANACDVGGLDFGVKQIEKILGQKADYLVFMGFSQALGIFRYLDLPANETMQWLRLRQPYAIGEPQRARNHSNFIKQMIIKFSPQINSKTNLALAPLIFQLIRTDLTFNQGMALAKTVAEMDISNQPEYITLLMRPPYDVHDIPYTQENLNENIETLLKPIADIIPEGAYAGQTEEEAQQELLNKIKDGLTDEEFVKWAFANYLWLQIEDETQRETTHYELLERYINLLDNPEERNQIITDYIIEKEDLGQDIWSQQGRDLIF